MFWVVYLLWTTLIHIIVGDIVNISACCPPDWSLAKIQMGLLEFHKYECVNTTEAVTKNIEILADGQLALIGHHAEQLTEVGSAISSNIPNCDHQMLVIFSQDNNVELGPRACLTSIADTIAAIICPSNENVTKQNLSFIHKCCPLHYVYSANQQKCVEHANILSNHSKFSDRAAVFVFDRIDCSKDKVLVEYHLNADQFDFYEDQLRMDINKLFNFNDYCIEIITNETATTISDEGNISDSSANDLSKFIIRTCDVINICKRLPCIRRCCSDGEIFTKGNATSYCKRDASDIGFNSFESLEISGNFSKPSVFGILRSLDCLKFRLNPEAYADEAHTISNKDGALRVMSTKKSYSNSQYCVEKVHNSFYVDQKLYTYLCFDYKTVVNDKIRFKLYPIGLLISCSFYAITLLVYLSVSRLRNLPGKILICLVCSLFLAYLGIALGQLMPTPNDDVCFIFGFFVYFCLMAAFAWMNVMCFDIWQTFGSTKRKHGLKKNHNKQFCLYSLYGWGLATFMTVLTVTLTKLEVMSENYRPHFGHGRCWFTYDTLTSANLLFFSGPVGVLFLINFVLFALTLRYCNKVKREIFRMQSSNTEKPALRKRFFMDKARFAMNTKLFIVMGITWVLEILSILFYDHKKTFFWAISDSFNVLLGVFVFFIFVFKKRVWYSVLETFGLQTRNNTKNAPHLTCATQSTCVQSMSLTRLNATDRCSPRLQVDISREAKQLFPSI